MRLSKDWQTILRFVAFGVATSVVFAGYELVDHSSPSNPTVYATLVLLCPASILFAPRFAQSFEAAEPGAPLFYMLWTCVAQANGALYAVAGAAYVGLQRKQIGTAPK